MVDGISGAGAGRIEAARAQAAQRISTLQKPKAVGAAALTVAGAATRAAASGPPVDAEKVARIRAAIAEGRYPVDPKAIAQKMIDLDLVAGA